MRRTSLFHVLILTLPLFTTLHAQPDTLWTKAIGGELTDVFYSIEPVTGGGYIVGGYTESNADTLRKYWLARLNSAGDDTVWTRADTAGGTEGRMAIATSDGGAIIVGTGNPRVIKTDGDGVLLWQKDESDLPGGLFWIEETADNGLIACGVYQPNGVGSAYIVRMNSAGTVLWDTTYGGTNDSYGLSITELANGEFAMAGAFRSKSQPTANDAWVLKLSADGDSLGSVFYGDTAAVNSERFGTVRTTSDGGLILLGEQTLGEQTKDIILVKADGDGVSSWEEIFGGDDALSGEDVIQTSDGGFAVIGYGDLTSQGGFDLILIHTDANGTTDWTKQITTPYGAAGTALTEISASEYLAVGVVNPAAGTPMDGWIVRLGAAAGETVTWDGDTDNNWTTAANWSGDVVPGAGDDVVIDLDGATVLLPNGSAISVNSLTLGNGTGGTTSLWNTSATDNAGGFRLRITGDVTIHSDGIIDLRGSGGGSNNFGDSLTVTGTISNAGTVKLSRNSVLTGSVSNTGTLSAIKMDGYINGNLTNSTGGEIQIEGDAYNFGHLNIDGNLTNSGRVYLYTGTGDNIGGQSAYLEISGILTNTGTGTVLDSSDTYYDALRTIKVDSFDNQGTFLARAQTSYYKFSVTTSGGPGTFQNSGHMDIAQSMSFGNIGTFTNTGTITIDTSKTLNLYGYEYAGTYTGSGEQFQGNGSLSLAGIAMDVTTFPPLDSLSLAMSNSSSLTLTDSLIVQSSVTVTGSSISAVGIRNQGSLTIDGGGSLSSPDKAITNNGTMLLTGGSVTGVMVNNDSLDAKSGTSLLAGLTNNEGAKLAVTASTPQGLIVDGNLTNHGLMILKPQASSSYTLLSVTNGSLINSATGTIQGVTGYTGSSNSYIYCNLVNEGLFDNHFKIAFRGDSTHTNSGTIHVNQGAAATYLVQNSTLAFELGATLTNTGTVFLDDTCRLQISSATYHQEEGSTLEGSGTLYLINGTGHLGQKFIVDDFGTKLLAFSSTIYVDSLINRSTWTTRGNTIHADSVILNQGKLILEPYYSSGYINNNWYGPMINEDTLIVEPYAAYTTTHYRADEELHGPVVNAAGGVLLIQSSTYATAGLTVDSSLTNHGTLKLLNADGGIYSVSLDVTKGWLTNTGTIDNLIYGTLTADLDNQGTFNIAPNTTFTMDKNPQIILNSGTMHVSGGEYFSVTYLDSLVITETGLLTIDAGCTAKFRGPTASGYFPTPDAEFITLPGGEVSLGGTIEGTYLSIYPGSTLYVGSGQRAAFTSCRVVADSLINDGHIAMSNSSVLAEVLNQDTLITRLYGAAFDSTLVNAAGAIIRGEGNYSNGWTYLNVQKRFANHGELELTTISTTSKGIQVQVATDTLVNSSTGSIDALVGISTNAALEHKFHADVINQGSLLVDSAATLTVAGTSFDNEPGGVVQGAGILDVTSVEFVSGGAINPGGSPGIFTIEGDVALEATNVINLELEGDEPGTGYDQLHVTGNAALAGSLMVNISDLYSPEDGRSFQPLVFGSSSGVFESFTAQGGGTFLTAQFTETGLYLTANISGGNNWPFIGGIADITVPEDTSFAIVLVAFDPDEGDVLTFSASSDTPAVEVVLAGDTLKITPELNWNGTAIIQMIVSDLAGLMDTTDFALTFSPVQDKPLPFDLMAPLADSTVTITAENQYSQSLQFSWDESVDPDGDAVGYDLVLTGDLEQLPAKTIYGSDTYVSWMYYEITTAMSDAGMSQFTGTWTIAARDQADTTVAANGPFTLTIDASAVLGIDGQGLIPEAYALHSNYPNPFNPSTTIRYDLPEAADMSLVVYDMLGREVARLAQGRMEAGYHQMIWNGRTTSGREVPSGLYIVRMVTAEYTKSMKMVLLK